MPWSIICRARSTFHRPKAWSPTRTSRWRRRPTTTRRSALSHSNCGAIRLSASLFSSAFIPAHSRKVTRFTIRVYTHEDTGQTIIAGMGELHLEIIRDRMFREFKVDANAGKPQIAYRETITSNAHGVGKLIKQSGGRGQYGHVEVDVRPGDR